jgi:hypothetical protein
MYKKDAGPRKLQWAGRSKAFATRKRYGKKKKKEKKKGLGDVYIPSTGGGP